MFWKEVLLICLATLLPLAPSIALYKIFGKENFSTFTGVDKGIKLGGPIAAYFIIFVVLLKVVSGVDAELLHWVSLEKKAHEAVVGDWVILSKVSPEEGEEDSPPVNGKAYITIEENSLGLHIAGAWLDNEGDVAGTWDAEELYVSSSKLILLWHVDTGVEVITGVGSLSIRHGSQGEAMEMRGSWGVIGRPQHGMMLWVRDIGIGG